MTHFYRNLNLCALAVGSLAIGQGVLPGQLTHLVFVQLADGKQAARQLGLL